MKPIYPFRVLTFIFVAASLLVNKSAAQSDLNLSSIQQSLRQSHPAWVNTKFDVNLAYADTITANLRINPLLNAQPLFLLRKAEPVDGFAWGPKQAQVWVQLTQQFQTANKRPLRKELAKQQAVIVPLEARINRQQVVIEAANLLNQLWLVDENLKVRKRLLSNLDQVNEIAKVKLRNEAITQLEAIRTANLLRQYQTEIAQAGIARKSLLNQLQTLAFLPLDSVNVEVPIAIPNPFPPLDSILSFAGKNQPILQQSEQREQIALANQNFQKAMAKPNFEAGGILNPQNGVPYMGVYFTLPLPFYDKNQGEIAKAEISIEREKQYRKKISQSLENQITSLYLELQGRKTNFDQLNKLVTENESILTTVRYNYQNGNTTMLDFLQAQRSYLESLQALNMGKSDEMNAWLQLQYLMGVWAE